MSTAPEIRRALSERRVEVLTQTRAWLTKAMDCLDELKGEPNGRGRAIQGVRSRIEEEERCIERILVEHEGQDRTEDAA